LYPLPLNARGRKIQEKGEEKDSFKKGGKKKLHLPNRSAGEKGGNIKEKTSGKGEEKILLIVTRGGKEREGRVAGLRGGAGQAEGGGIHPWEGGGGERKILRSTPGGQDEGGGDAQRGGGGRERRSSYFLKNL